MDNDVNLLVTSPAIAELLKNNDKKQEFKKLADDFDDELRNAVDQPSFK